MSDGERIDVERGGIRLGWNLAAMIAAIVFGLYLGQLLSPLKHQLASLEKERVVSDQVHRAIEAELALIRTRTQAIELEHAVQKDRLERLRRDLDRNRGAP